MQSVNKAIAAFQSECPAIIKDTQAFKYKYADLAAIMTVIQPLLTKHGLLVSHSVADMHVVTGVIHHDSGEYVTTSTPILGCSTMQDLGSAITYARRYNISCLLNIITDVDTDAAEISKKPDAKVSNTPVKPTANNPQVVEKVDRNNPQHQQKAFEILTELKHPDAPDLVKVVMARTHGKVTVTDLKQFIVDSYKV